MVSKGAHSGIEKRPTGIEGLDLLLHGGLPARRLTLLLGSAGTGKSMISLQALYNAARAGTPGLVVCFEETPSEILENVGDFDWDMGDCVERTLHFMEAHVGDDFFAAGDFDITGLLAAVASKVAATGAQWVVFDGLDALLRALGGHRAGLRELLRLRRWIGEQGVATIVTAKSDEPDSGAYGSEFGFLPFVADCVVRLSHDVVEGVFVRSIRVSKHRGGPSAGAQVPFVIDRRGIAVAYSEGRRLDHQVSEMRLSTGVSRLDHLIGGGYLRASSVLVSGAPGTAKTTLAAALAQAACAHGEKALFVSFDESAAQIVRNMRSVGIDLGAHQQSGLLRVEGFRAHGFSAEDHLLEIEALMQAHRPAVLLIDPVSALAKAGGHRLAAGVTERLLDRAKSLGVTVLMTSLLADLSPDHEGTASHVSTIADTWIALSYNVHGGERNRAITIIKARGTQHSNQVRELRLTAHGPTLTDVYTAGGEVLMGTARLEREAQVQRARERREIDYELQRNREAAEIDELAERINALTRQLETRRRRLEALRANYTKHERSREDEASRVRQARHADADRARDE